MLIDTSDRLVELPLTKRRPLTWRLGPFYRVCLFGVHIASLQRESIPRWPKTFAKVRVHMLDISRQHGQADWATADSLAVPDVEIRPHSGFGLIYTLETIRSSGLALPAHLRCAIASTRCNLTSITVFFHENWTFVPLIYTNASRKP